MRRNVLFVGCILLVAGLGIISHGFVNLQLVSGRNIPKVNQRLRELAYSEFAIGVVLACIGPLLWLVYGRSSESKRV